MVIQIIICLYLFINILFSFLFFRSLLAQSVDRNIRAFICFGTCVLLVSYGALFSPFIAKNIWILGLTLSALFLLKTGKSLINQIDLFAVFWLTTFALIMAFTFWDQPEISVRYVNAVWINELPIDNQISLMFAEAMMRGDTQFKFGDWLGSDRPPLMSGFYLLFRSPFLESELAYQIIGTAVQCSVVPISIWVLQVVLEASDRKQVLPPFITLFVLILTTPLFIIHSTFLWPKILSASFLLLFVPLYLGWSVQLSHRSSGLYAGAAASLGFLSHGAGIFYLISAALGILLLRKLGSIKTAAVTVTTFVAMNLPWIYYQKMVNPPGDRLLKWHLAGQIPVTEDSFKTVLQSAYSDINYLDILARVPRACGHSS